MRSECHFKVEAIEGEQQLVGEDEDQDHPHQREVHLQESDFQESPLNEWVIYLCGGFNRQDWDVELTENVGEEGVAGEVQQPLVLRIIPGHKKLLKTPTTKELKLKIGLW